jgi:alpha-L-fucosidase 2
MDEDGFLIGKDVKMRTGHRHYSHLLMLYPLGNFDLTVPENQEIAWKSIRYWLDLPSSYYVGYTYTGASSMSTVLGDGEEAYRYLNVFFDRYLQPNTFYRESGPVFETPMSALASWTEMLLKSGKEWLRIMPAVPAVWSEIAYDRLLAEGGFEVSARREDGKVTSVTVKSLHGGKCKIYPGIESRARKVSAPRNTVTGSGDDFVEVTLAAGQTVTITRR